MRLHKSLPKLIFILISFGTIIVVTEFLTRELIFSDQTETIALTNANQKTKERENLLTNFFSNSENTVRAIRSSQFFNQFLNSQLKDKKEFEQLALSIAISQQDIMKIRFIDKNGMEIVRIDRDKFGDEAKIVAENKLQNKSHRYFFYDSAGKQPEQIWFSHFDLNEDNGRVEIPYKPTVRAVMPLSYKNTFSGILIINYFTKPLFDTFANAPLYQSILVDSDGEILLHYDKSRNWSRYSKNDNIYKDIPDFEELVSNATYQNSNIYSRKLNLPNDQQLILILSLNSTYSHLQASMSHKSFLYSSGITLFITIVFGFIFASVLSKFFTDYANRGNYIEKLMDLNLRINNLNQKNKLYMEMASDGIHILDKKGNIVAFSHSFAELLGYSEEETAKLNVRDWEAKLKPDEIFKTMATFGTEAKKYETRHRRKDGTIIDVELNAKWIKAADGRYFYASSRDITDRIRLEKELHKLATTDALTQLPTRRVFMERLATEMERYHRKQCDAVTVIFIDLDNFKAINDTYGHAGGDKVLVSVANILMDEIRKVDSVGRLGGEEFGLILTGTTAEMSVHFTNRIRKRIEECPVVLDHSVIHCTASMGITTINMLDTDTDKILERADKALYRAKHLGRNRVEVFKELA
ncbi:sensor domain-containing diguanylate cyclase [Vibrio diazotrophicus]|uniref:sensor domain-containing diguanylate cyclase n=1 Tax=Vibrio diazotrophicus TaxID=685 RepID=UPI00142E26E1|nr:diguanylate cyclase [Vibrio diazotrophicus]NIY92136.1 diguanylate cyclase [Vibrio diazotrophicus]